MTKADAPGARSLIATTKINGVGSFACLKATPEAIANGHPQGRIDDLLPRTFRPPSRERVGRRRRLRRTIASAGQGGHRRTGDGQVPDTGRGWRQPDGY